MMPPLVIIMLFGPDYIASDCGAICFTRRLSIAAQGVCREGNITFKCPEYGRVLTSEKRSDGIGRHLCRAEEPCFLLGYWEGSTTELDEDSQFGGNELEVESFSSPTRRFTVIRGMMALDGNGEEHDPVPDQGRRDAVFGVSTSGHSGMALSPVKRKRHGTRFARAHQGTKELVSSSGGVPSSQARSQQ